MKIKDKEDLLIMWIETVGIEYNKIDSIKGFISLINCLEEKLCKFYWRCNT